MQRKNQLLFSSMLNIWALLIGIGLLSVSSGLQGTLLGIRASVEGFSTIFIGLMMSSFYFGFLFGAAKTPQLVRKVGHPRVFAAMASLSSITVLLHYVVVDPLVWCILRAITGFTMASLYVVAESWLNNMAPKKVRGQMLSFYAMVQHIGTAAGYVSVNLADAENVILYLLTSILVSASLIPVLLSTGKTPRFDDLKSLNVKELFNDAPLSVVGALMMGLIYSAVYTMSVIYCQMMGLTVAQTSFFLFWFVVAGAAVQWPIGYLSDKLDRRVLIVMLLMFSTASILALGENVSDPVHAIICMAIYGASVLSVYPLIVAHTNDRLEPAQMIAASSTMFSVYGIAAIIGPVTCSYLMQVMSGEGFITYLFVLQSIMGIYTLYRIIVREGERRVKDATSSFITMGMSRSLSPLVKVMVKVANKKKK